MICTLSNLTLSGIYCCFMPSGYRYTGAPANPPACDSDAAQCPRALGGGCCPNGTTCARAGCVRELHAAAGFGVTADDQALMADAGEQRLPPSGSAPVPPVLATGVRTGEVVPLCGVSGDRSAASELRQCGTSMVAILLVITFHVVSQELMAMRIWS